jgi:uncharacterized integral membrane protein
MSRDQDDAGPDRDREPGDEERAARRGDAESWSVRRSGPSPRLVLVLVLAVVLIVFAALNFRPVRVNFLLFTTRARVVSVIAVAALLGFVVGWFVGRPTRDERRHLRDWRASKTGGEDRR